MLIYRSASMVYMSNTGQTLNRQQVIAIRKQRAAGNKIGDIARGYRVSRKTVSRVVNWQSHKIVQDILFPPIPRTPGQKARANKRYVDELQHRTPPVP